MENNNLLDEQELNIRKDATLEMVAWWEKRRMVYNLVLLGIGVLGIIVLYHVSGYRQEYSPLANAFRGAIFYGVLANICYTSGWILEIFIRHYIAYNIPKTLRMILWSTGLGFSIFVTIALVTMLHFVSPYLNM